MVVHYVNTRRPPEVVQPRLQFTTFMRSQLTSGFVMEGYGVPQKAEVHLWGMAGVPALTPAGDINVINISASRWISGNEQTLGYVHTF